MTRDKPSWVYFVRRVDGEGPVKIGCSQSPVGRLNTLMTWAPYPLEIAATIPGDESLERRFHTLFAEQHSHREWFRPSAGLSIAIAEIAAGAFDVDSLPVGKRLSVVRDLKPWTAEQRAEASVNHRLSRITGPAWAALPDHVRAYYRTWRLERTVEAREAVKAWLDAEYPMRGKAA